MSSGAIVNWDVNAKSITCEGSSGSNIILKGTTVKANFDASSGSGIKADEIDIQNAEVSASSGSSVMLGKVKELIASTSSGAVVKYSDDSTNVIHKKSTNGGKIKVKKNKSKNKKNFDA